MTYYVTLEEKTIQIIPRWKIKLSAKHLTDEEFVQEAALLALNGEFYIPLSKFKIDQVPQKVTILYGNTEYNKLEDVVEHIYKNRSYSLSEESAKNRIRNLVIKALLQKKKIYGKEINYTFDLIDASNYKIGI